MTPDLQPKVTTIILTWNSADFIEACVQSVGESDYKTHILVVDNDSADNTRDIVARTFPDVEVINTSANLGYSGGNNFGINKAIKDGADYVFVLNPDTEVSKDCITHLVHRLQAESQLAAVSPKIYHYKNDDIWFSGAVIKWYSGNTSQLNGPDEGQYADEKYTGRLTGCAMLIPSAVIKETGPMDDRFFLFYEETDWSARFIEAGYRLGVEQQAIMWHKASASTGGYVSPTYQYYMTRNRLLFIQKHRPQFLLSTFLISLYDSALSIAVTSKRKGVRRGIAVTKAIGKGYFDFTFRRFGKRNLSA